MWEISPFTLVVFRLNDCTTNDCEAIEPSRINLALKTTTDGCAIHDTRIGVPISVRLHKGLDYVRRICDYRHTLGVDCGDAGG